MTARLSVRPTLRCLRDDLGVAKLPPLNESLAGVDHPILRKANAAFSVADAPAERIVSVDDTVLFKVKIQRWRGAVWRPLPDQWLVAAGRREAGSPDDFYNELADRGRRWRAEHNAQQRRALATDTFTEPLLPTDFDRRRLVAEDATARALAYRTAVPVLVRAAYAAGREQQDEIAGYRVAVLIEQRELDETYVGLRLIGKLEVADHAVILAQVPGTDPEGWFIDAMPHRDPEPGEIVWSNLIDTTALHEHDPRH